MDRAQFIRELGETDTWDIVVIGGGATGLGTALDAASRGYKTLLLEQADFTKGTSSRSTKLVHGGVRYLAQGNISLVYEALHERGLMLLNAPHLVKKQKFIIPFFNWKSGFIYLAGLKLYDWLAGRLSFGSSKFLSKSKILQQIPGLKDIGLKGGIEYYDGQFDDARLGVNIAQTAAQKGGVVLNYFKVTGLLKNDEGKIQGVVAVDLENEKEYQLRTKAVVNATGVFADDILQMDSPSGKRLVRPSQGVHVVLDKSFMDSDSAMMIPKTSDGRVLFAVPWQDHVLLGTTDTPLDENSLEPKALDKEVDFIIKTAGQYLKRPPQRNDVLSIFAGLRPLAVPEKDPDNTKEISRSHKLLIAASGLITIVGGKWTTYRKMAEETVNKAIKTGKLKWKACITKNLRIHGYSTLLAKNHLSMYGADEPLIRELIRENNELKERLTARLPHTCAEVVWAVRNEMGRTVEDVLARRLRVLFLDAVAAIEMAPRVAALIAKELGYDASWQARQVKLFTELANRYLLRPYEIRRPSLCGQAGGVRGQQQDQL